MAEPKAKPKPRPKNYQKMTAKQRFIEAARAAAADETGETFERAFEKIVPPKPIQFRKDD